MSLKGLGCAKTQRDATVIELTFIEIAVRCAKNGQTLPNSVDLSKIILMAFQFFAFSHSLGQTLHFCDVRVVSAFHPIATKSRTFRHFGCGPLKLTHAVQQITAYLL
jgi:hypothetical protein